MSATTGEQQPDHDCIRWSELVKARRRIVELEIKLKEVRRSRDESERQLTEALVEVKRLVNLPAVQQPNRDALIEALASIPIKWQDGAPVGYLLDREDAELAADAVLAALAVPATGEARKPEAAPTETVSTGEHKRVLHQGTYVCDTCVNSLGLNIRWDRIDLVDGHPQPEAAPSDTDLVDRLAVVLIEAWSKAEPDSPVTKHPASYVATFADMARAVLSRTSRPVQVPDPLPWGLYELIVETEFVRRIGEKQ